MSTDRRWTLVRDLTARLYALGARRVWLFGSLARGARADAKSDLDLAVEGMPTSVGREGLRRIARGHGIRVDIIDIDTVEPRLREDILTQRVLLDRIAPRRPQPQFPRAGRPRRTTETGEQRIQAVLAVLRRAGARRVLDLGCGEGEFLVRCMQLPGVEAATGIDRSPDRLAVARRRVVTELRSPDRAPALVVGSITSVEVGPRVHDTAVAIEVIEHLEPEHLKAFEHVLFERLEARLIAVTTPNHEHNLLYHDRRRRRLDEHHFELNRAGFAAWARHQAARGGYRVTVTGIGADHPVLGPPTQMAVFLRTECASRGPDRSSGGTADGQSEGLCEKQ